MKVKLHNINRRKEERQTGNEKGYVVIQTVARCYIMEIKRMLYNRNKEGKETRGKEWER